MPRRSRSHRPLVRKTGRPPAAKSSAQVRACAQHGLVEFHLYDRDTYPRWRCKRCIGEAVTRRHQEIKRILVAEAGGRCAVCGYDRCIINLHVHHIDPATKEFAITVASGKGLAKYRVEALKCVMVCANCHGEIETGLIPCPAPGARYTGP